jgi:hypothetical protein
MFDCKSFKLGRLVRSSSYFLSCKTFAFLDRVMTGFFWIGTGERFGVFGTEWDAQLPGMGHVNESFRFLNDEVEAGVARPSFEVTKRFYFFFAGKIS